MQLDEALDRIDHIYGHLDRTEVYRGYRPIPVALGGVLAIAGGPLQAWLVPADDAVAYVLLWVGICAVALACVAGQIIHEWWTRPSAAFRRTTSHAIWQLAPHVTAGACLTAHFTWNEPGLIPLLPSLWTTLFGLGIFASRPYLPRATGWLGLFYFLAGVTLLVVPEPTGAPSAWIMPVVFGPGQLLAALVLYWNLERRPHVQEAAFPEGSAHGARR